MVNEHKGKMECAANKKKHGRRNEKNTNRNVTTDKLVKPNEKFIWKALPTE